MGANCNHKVCRLIYSKIKSHFIYNTTNYNVTQYVTQRSQCSSVSRFYLLIVCIVIYTTQLTSIVLISTGKEAVEGAVAELVCRAEGKSARFRIVCCTAVFSVVTQRSSPQKTLRDDTKKRLCSRLYFA